MLLPKLLSKFSGGGYDLDVVDFVEIDKYAINSYNAINDTNFSTQDITLYDKKYEDIDIIVGGFPCQDISAAGKQAGIVKGETRSGLMYEMMRIVDEIKPKYVVTENVKNLLSNRFKPQFDEYLNFLDIIGYNTYYKVLNSKDYGIPQHRERVFVVAIRKDIDNGKFEFPKTIILDKTMKDLLEEKVDEKYYLSDKMIKYISEDGTKNFKLNDSKINLDIARPITTCQNKRAGTTNYISDVLPNNFELNSIKIGSIYPNKQAGSIYSQEGLCPTITTEASNNWNILLKDGLRIRKLTPKECWRLMGFSDEAFEKARQINSDTQLYKQAGNSIVVNVLAELFKSMFSIG